MGLARGRMAVHWTTTMEKLGLNSSFNNSTNSTANREYRRSLHVVSVFGAQRLRLVRIVGLLTT